MPKQGLMSYEICVDLLFRHLFCSEATVISALALLKANPKRTVLSTSGISFIRQGNRLALKREAMIKTTAPRIAKKIHRLVFG